MVIYSIRMSKRSILLIDIGYTEKKLSMSFKTNTQLKCFANEIRDSVKFHWTHRFAFRELA